ncbi:hypothetical protein Zmor_004108 [Zophobas morio]|uniref:Uncharacterized protein n=2 Tax=Zophobas morio TaxID=2755281 RepID=A0AA38LZJ5_9CUCU|nr:hypothetical protein Zmor_004108 [Zophobas morio]
MLGAGGVGKTSITVQFTQSTFQTVYDPTILETYHKRIVVDGVPVAIDVVDTAGQEEYTLLSDHTIRGGDAYVVVFSITDADSLEEAKSIINQVKRIKEFESFPCIMAANKADLQHERELTNEEILNSLRDLDVGYLETSAKNRLNIEECFCELTRQARRAPKKIEKVPSHCCVLL